MLNTQNRSIICKEIEKHAENTQKHAEKERFQSKNTQNVAKHAEKTPKTRRKHAEGIGIFPMPFLFP